jgi:LacI family transcriptional regulator
MTAAIRPTLAEVASRAGVSLKTASRALNNEYGVANDTARRVFAAADELGYRRNQLAGALASRQTSATVALVVPTVSDPFFAAVAAEVESSFGARNFGLISVSHGDDMPRQRRQIKAMVERRVDAIVVVSAPGDSSYLQLDIDRGLVVVALDRPLDGVEVDTVVLDNRAAGHDVVTELIAAGHDRIALVGFDGALWTASERQRGYESAHLEAGIPLDATLVAPYCTDARQAQQQVTAMLRTTKPPTAVLALHNRAGRAAVRAILGTRANVELAVFDDVTDPDLLQVPPSIVVASDPGRMGVTAAALTLERLDAPHARPRNVVLAPLFLRDAVAAARRTRTLEAAR